MDQSEQKKLTVKERKQYTGKALRIMKLLGQGLLAHEISKAIGTDESYISQLKAEPDFIEQVNEIVSATFADQSKVDEDYNKIEKTAVERLLKNIDLEYSTDRLLRVAKFANEAKRKLAPALTNPGANGNGTTILQPVTLILPMVVAKEFILNPMNEIVGIGQEPLQTLPSGNMGKLVEKHRVETEKSKLEQKQKFRILENGARQQDPWGNL